MSLFAGPLGRPALSPGLLDSWLTGLTPLLRPVGLQRLLTAITPSCDKIRTAPGPSSTPAAKQTSSQSNSDPGSDIGPIPSGSGALSVAAAAAAAVAVSGAGSETSRCYPPPRQCGGGPTSGRQSATGSRRLPGRREVIPAPRARRTTAGIVVRGRRTGHTRCGLPRTRSWVIYHREFMELCEKTQWFNSEVRVNQAADKSDLSDF